jgi:teichuronic acid biosynthesis glycosyltransferase TuaC
MDDAGSPPARGLTVAMLHPCYWPEVRRGSERFIHDLGVRLAARGHRPRLITSHPAPTSEATEDGLEVLRLHRPPGRRLQLGLRDQFLTHVPGSMRALRRMDPDLAHALYPPDAVAASRWSRRTGRPLVFSLMGMPRPEAMRRAVWPRVVARALARADVSVCLSGRAAELTEEAFGVATRVIHPGVDLEAFHPTAGRAPVPTILCPADLGDLRKRGPLLLAAFRALRASQPDARLVLSRPRGQLEHETAPGVEYAPLDDRESLVRAYSEAWVTVLLSRAEAFGLVLAESLACGTPVVGTAGGGADEVVGGDDGVGRVIEDDDPDSIAEAIAESMGGEDVRSVCRARAGEFSANRCAAAYEELYRELV